jgi:hypothetical protein
MFEDVFKRGKISRYLGLNGFIHEPVISASGELIPDKLCVESLLQDGGEFARYGNNAVEMVRHAVNFDVENDGVYRETLDFLAEGVEEVLRGLRGYERSACLIAGGQRRDWLFSGPVAARLNLGHVALYKECDEISGIELFSPWTKDYKEVCYIGRDVRNLLGSYVIVISDLLRTGSSHYRKDGGEKYGWIPRLRKTGAVVEHCFFVAARGSKGILNLNKVSVNIHAVIPITKRYLEKWCGSLNGYDGWYGDYLKENGALEFCGFFDPSNGLDKVGRFLRRYGDIIKKCGRWDELSCEVERTYGIRIDDVVKLP